jgi:hypothetical protein
VVSRWRRDNPRGFDDPLDENALAAFATTTMALQYGDVTRAELVRLADSMAPLVPWGRRAGLDPRRRRG